jgi:hypothetical protein
MRILSRVRTSLAVLSLIVPILVMVSSADAHSRSGPGRGSKGKAESIHSPKAALPNPQQRVHRIPDVRVCMTNWGLMGSQGREYHESLGGCFNPDPGEQLPAPSFEYPPGSGLEYLFQGALWIGAMVNDYPYTTVGCDGWMWIFEMWPEAGEEGAIREKSILPFMACFSPDAVSEQDVIAVYTDTSADIPLSPWKPETDDWDGRKHFPLGVEVTQKSYSWHTDGVDKLIIVEYTIQNIGVHLVSEVYIGFYLDGDALHIDENPYGPYGAQDDVTGFLKNYEISPGDIRDVNIAWIADNDGHGRAGEVTWSEFSPRSVLGMKVLHTPNPDLQISYNWWVSYYAGYPRDWGPWIATNLDVWESMNPYGSGSLFPGGGLGTPGGDVSKYFIMSNQEFDYDQLFACTWPEGNPEWLGPSPECDDLADGYDTRFLLSFGPFDQIAPGDSLTFAVAYVIGENLHVDPLNWQHSTTPEEVHANLDFVDLVHNALAAESLYHDLILNDPPGFFSLLFPPNKAFTPRGVRFDWDDAADPDPSDEVRYDLYVSTSYYFPPDSTTIDADLAASEHVKTLDYGSYWWKVKAKDDRGGERWSNQMRCLVVTGVPYLTLGDLNADGHVDVGDLVFVISYLYRSGPAPDPLELADINCDDLIDVADAVFLISYLFRAGPAPLCP